MHNTETKDWKTHTLPTPGIISWCSGLYGMESLTIISGLMTNFEDLYQVSKTFDKKWIRILSIRHEWIKIHEIPWGKLQTTKRPAVDNDQLRKQEDDYFYRFIFQISTWWSFSKVVCLIINKEVITNHDYTWYSFSITGLI